MFLLLLVFFLAARARALPRRVSKKKKASKAYPIGSGEYVVDIDSYLNHKPHSHRTRNNEACPGCLENAKELSMRVLDKLAENYSDIRIVFSGRAGFHCHVLDFDVRDWTHVDEDNIVKSLEVGRLKYTTYLAKQIPEAFDRAHFILSCDVMRVMSVPESLNALTGLLCSYLGNPHEFGWSSVDDILRKAKRAKASIVGLGWTKASALEIRPISSHLESIT